MTDPGGEHPPRLPGGAQPEPVCGGGEHPPHLPGGAQPEPVCGGGEHPPRRPGAGQPGGDRRIRVLVADDQRVVRDGLEMLLGLMSGVQVVGSASDGDEALALTGRVVPDVVLMDLRMPGCDGVEATRRLAQRHPDVRVVVLTTYADDRSVLDALRAGARGFLTKDAGADDIERALCRVVDGYAAIDPAVAHHLVDAISGTHAWPGPPAGSPSSVAPALPAEPPAADSAAVPPPLPGGLTQRQAEVLGR
jgi:DNA-binding NarL/FixJ family response regulator